MQNDKDPVSAGGQTAAAGRVRRGRARRAEGQQAQSCGGPRPRGPLGSTRARVGVTVRGE